MHYSVSYHATYFRSTYSTHLFSAAVSASIVSLSATVSTLPLTSSFLPGKFKKTAGAKSKRKSLAVAAEGRCGVMVGPRVELRMRSREGKNSVVTSLVWHHKVCLHRVYISTDTISAVCVEQGEQCRSDLDRLCATGPLLSF